MATSRDDQSGIEQQRSGKVERNDDGRGTRCKGVDWLGFDTLRQGMERRGKAME